MYSMRFKLILALTACLAFGATACAPNQWGIEYSVSSVAAPPMPYNEVVGMAPGPGYVWISGHWAWNGADYVWVRGSWDVPPTVGYQWVRSGWTYQRGSYVFVRGGWRAPGATVRVRYVHPPPSVRIRRGSGYRRVTPTRRSGTRVQVR